jgi:hypothetical protein
MNVDVHDVVQIDPAHDEVFGGCLLVVTEVKGWGVQGFVQVPGQGQAYYRVRTEACARVGRLHWTPAPDVLEIGGA